MTKFEERGVTLQKTAGTKEIATRRYENGCDICSCHGLHIRCDHCAIAEAHKLVIAAFSAKEEQPSLGVILEGKHKGKIIHIIGSCCKDTHYNGYVEYEEEDELVTIPKSEITIIKEVK